MPFYDRMGDTLKQAGQKAGQKAGELVDVTKLNGKIAETNRRINQRCQEIGEKYVSLHQTDPEAELAQQVAEVVQMQDQVREWNDQIQALRGMVRCPNCQNYVAKDAVFCTKCGAQIQP